jgi:branched-subunit amino acid transport protein
MSEVAVWSVIVGLTAVTFATRSAFLVLGRRFTLPPRLLHALRYAPVCALMALIAPELLVVDGAIAPSLFNPKLVAGLACGAMMLATRSMMASMAVGMLAFSVLRLLPQ